MSNSSFYSNTGITSADVSSITSAKEAAATSETNAATSATEAATSATQAATSATNAASSETNVSNSAATATTSAANASTSETNASASAATATTQASNAATSATAAAGSASTAGTSATNAASSATNAATSETNAATSETNAATSATSASTSATNAGTSETNAAASASAASGYVTSVTTQANNAATSATAAATSETNSATSATAASTSASGASTSASNANTSATNAASSASQAASSAAAAALAADNFDDTYLGSNASDPTTDNDGDALNAGDLHFNTTSNTLKVYNGSAWQDAAIDSSGFVQTTGDTMTGNLSMGDNVKAIFGAGSDLSIFHNGSASIIEDSGTGGLTIRSNLLTVQNAAGNETVAQFVQDGFVKLFHNNSQVFTTTSGGASITGSLGIGTSPAADLHVNSGASNLAGLFESTDAGATISLIDNGTTGGSAAEHGLNTVGNQLEIRAVDNLSFETAASEAMRITSAGNVGIGTSTPHDLGSSFAVLNLDGSNGGAIAFSEDDNATDQWLIYTNSDDSLRFAYGSNYATEAMRIDTSGNLLVGTTTILAAESNVEGISLAAGSYGGLLSVSRDGNRAATFNRKTSDGEIVEFRKDGSTVGSIGVQDDDLWIGEGGVGLQFQNTGTDRVDPFDVHNNAVRDNAIDLGGSSSRYSDLFLGGGVYLGGTGSANKLDDYEFGFFEPTYTSNGTNPSGITYDPTVGNEGRYTKIGGLVHIQINIRTDAISNKGTGSLRISGLPFTAGSYSSQGGYATFSCSAAGFLNNQPSAAQVPEGATYLELLYRSTSDDDVEAVSTSALNTGSNDNLIRIAGTYMTEE